MLLSLPLLSFVQKAASERSLSAGVVSHSRLQFFWEILRGRKEGLFQD